VFYGDFRKQEYNLAYASEDAPTIFVGLDGDVANVTPVLESVEAVLA
jgi:hypothetical protein